MAEVTAASSSEPTSSNTAGSLFTDVVAVFTLVVATTGMAISMAVLVFAGDLAAGLSRAIGAFMFAGGLLSIWMALRSRIVPVSTIIQDGPAIVIAVVAGQVFASGDSPAIADIFVLLFITSLATGVVMLLLGHFRLGGLVRYIPTTVVSAFIAGTGWLLFKGGFEVMLDKGVGLGDIAGLFGGDQVRFWVPGFLLGLLLWLLSRSNRVPAFVVGSVVLLSLITFYAVVTIGTSVAAVETSGWLVGPFPESAGITLVTPSEVVGANWSAIGSSVVGIASVVGLSVVALLLNLTGIGAQLAPHVDVDRELRDTGLGNIGASVIGASPGFHALGDTLILDRLGATRRAVPVVTGMILVVLGAVGVGAIGYVPRLVIGALLVMVGVELLEGWVGELRRSTNQVEQILSVGILLIIAWFGILEGIGAGVLAASGVFIVRYSRVDPVRAIGSGRRFRSQVDRSPAEVDALGEAADRFAVFELQGYLFFGSLTSLERQVRELALDEAGDSTLDTVVFDFKNVTGIDSSGYAIIARVFQELRDAGVNLLASSLDAQLQSSLTTSAPSLDHGVAYVSSLDEALEVCEDQQLNRLQGSEGIDYETDRAEVLRLSPTLASKFQEVMFPASTVVMEQDSPSDGMLVVYSGRLTAFRVDEDGVRSRLRRFGKGTIVGEIGVVTGAARTAEVVADSDVHALWLSIERYEQLRVSGPEAVFELHDFIMRVQAERIISLSTSLARSLR